MISFADGEETFPRSDPDFISLYQHAACGLLSFNTMGKIRSMNQTLQNWIGLEYSGSTDLSFSDLLEKGSQLYFQLFVHPLLRMHKEVREISLQMNSSSGSFQCLFSATAVGDELESTDLLVHAAIFKLVDRKKFEDELRLRKEKAEFETEQKIETLRKVASDQSHLVRAPLANILGLIALLEQTNTDGASTELLAMLKESARQLDSVIKNIVSTANG